jgi:pantoate--beta-alanine ligase
MTITVTTIKEWRNIRRELTNQSVGLVHTMGNLHAGHLSLCQHSQADNAVTVATIFVNPTQFNQAQDFDLYPRTIEQDKALLVAQKVDYLFLPQADEIYHDQYQIQVSETGLSLELEGKFRPGHFTGALTVVLKMLNIIQPTRSYYGEKDYQQLLLIKKMAAALFVPTEIIGCPTLRAEDSLALSSRNTRLTSAQREHAAHFPRLLQSALSIEQMTEQLTALGFKVEYIVDQWSRRLGAVWLEGVRLIDNVVINS